MKRWVYFLLFLLSILTGLLSRKASLFLPNFINTYLGDAIWAIMVYFLFRYLFYRLGQTKTALLALTFSYGIELSQFYHAPWLDEIRNTILGGLILGFGFLWSDIVAYTLGIVAAFFIDSKALNTK